MQKWFKIKMEIEQSRQNIYVNEREICFIHMGKNIGFEQNGKHIRFERPVVVIKKFGNQTFIGVPLTKQIKSGKFYFKFKISESISIAILSQIRLFDTKRVARKIGYIDSTQFILLKKALKKLLEV
jgi:mRNA interferase MazF